MASKRKNEENDDTGAKRQRFRKRARSEPLPSDTVDAEKKEVLSQVFIRIHSMHVEDERNRDMEEQQQNPNEEDQDYDDENEDPLLGTVPVNLDPEQLGFLVCAQETVQFLNSCGIHLTHPVFSHLRSRLMKGISEIVAA